MSCSIPRIRMNREFPAIVEDGYIIEAEQSTAYDVYVDTDGMSAWIGSCATIQGLEEIVSPEKFIDSIYESCSEVEVSEIIGCLQACNYKYEVFGDIRIAINE